MNPRRLLLLALLVEGGLGAVAVVWIRMAGLDVGGGDPMVGASSGVLTAFSMAAAGFWILERAPAGAMVRQFRDLCRVYLVPLFSRVSAWQIVAIGAMAGAGEELLFRGAIQSQLGWVTASVLFGLAHLGGIRTLALAVWATAAGLALGGLALVTGGVIAPMVAHGLYDVLAIAYLRFGYAKEAS